LTRKEANGFRLFIFFKMESTIKQNYEKLKDLHHPFDAQSLIDHCDDDKINALIKLKEVKKHEG